MSKKMIHVDHMKHRFFTMIEHAYTRFIKKKVKNFQILLTVVAVIFVWRGLRGLMDMYLLPNHGAWSMIVSILLGLLILSVDGKGFEELE